MTKKEAVQKTKKRWAVQTRKRRRVVSKRTKGRGSWWAVVHWSKGLCRAPSIGASGECAALGECGGFLACGGF